MFNIRDSGKPASSLSGVLVVLLLDYLSQHRTWGWLKLMQGGAALKGTPGLKFVKVMGSGSGGGFGLRPSSSHQGLIGLFDNQESADRFLDSLRVLDMTKRSREHWIGTLKITSVRGQWDHQSWSETTPHSLKQTDSPNDDVCSDGPVAVLTRASIHPSKAMAFWRYAPAAQEDLLRAGGCYLAMGLGEVPLVRQCTFSLWKDTPSMIQYAHSGAHGQAISAAKRHEFFSESMFIRMRVLNMRGTWQGRSFNQATEMLNA